MREKEFQGEIVDRAHTLGWRVASFPRIQDARGQWRTPVGADGKGFPDLLLVRDRVVAMEVKIKSDLSDRQAMWLTAFRMAGCEAYVIRPADWDSGAVDAILRRRSAHIPGRKLPEVVGCQTHGGLQSGPCPYCLAEPPGTLV